MNEDTLPPVRAARHARIIRARFLASNNLSGELLIRNVSARGIGARCDCPHLRAGDAISVELPVLGEVEGMVRWMRDGQCGIQTDHPLDVDRLRFRQDSSLLSSPEPFSVSARFQPVAKSYRPGLRGA